MKISKNTIEKKIQWLTFFYNCYFFQHWLLLKQKKTDFLWYDFHYVHFLCFSYSGGLHRWLRRKSWYRHIHSCAFTQWNTCHLFMRFCYSRHIEEKLRNVVEKIAFINAEKIFSSKSSIDNNSPSLIAFYWIGKLSFDWRQFRWNAMETVSMMPS